MNAPIPALAPARAIPVDALYLAGLRLDAAAAEFQRICRTTYSSDERKPA